VLALRASDGADTTLLDFGFPQGSAPGEWIFTPDRPFAFAPGWAHVTPFVLDDATRFRPKPPYALDSPQYAADLNEIKALGADGITTPRARTAEQTETALFWLESSPLQWNRIARTLSASRRLDPWESARLFGLLNMALADGYVSSFDTKYHYRYWRPVSAIRAAGTDGNPAIREVSKIADSRGRTSAWDDERASQTTLGRPPHWTTSESADRSRADAYFALAEQASEQAGPARLVLVHSGSDPSGG